MVGTIDNARGTPPRCISYLNHTIGCHGRNAAYDSIPLAVQTRATTGKLDMLKHCVMA